MLVTRNGRGTTDEEMRMTGEDVHIRDQALHGIGRRSDLDVEHDLTPVTVGALLPGARFSGGQDDGALEAADRLVLVARPDARRGVVRHLAG